MVAVVVLTFYVFALSIFLHLAGVEPTTSGAEIQRSNPIEPQMREPENDSTKNKTANF